MECFCELFCEMFFRAHALPVVRVMLTKELRFASKGSAKQQLEYYQLEKYSEQHAAALSYCLLASRLPRDPLLLFVVLTLFLGIYICACASGCMNVGVG